MEDFKNLIKQKENGSRKGFDSKSKTWKPHKSAEGGTDTIGWGHKLTAAEQAGGYVIIGEEKVPFAQLTEDKNNILFEQDWARKSQDAAKFINEKGDWNSLTEPQKLVSTELFYNLGNKATQYKNFRDKILTPNSNFIEEIDRSYTDTKGKKRSLTERTDPIKAWYKEQGKAPGVNPFEAQLQTAENAALISNFGAPKPKEVITDTETITEKGPGFIDRFTSGFKELYPFNEGGPVEEQITIENINVSEPDMYRNYRMQEAARRSMMQGNEEERMADYEDALFQSRKGGMAGNPYYPARIVQPTPPPMQAAQRMMGGGMGYAQGGTVDQAQGLASLGRGGDSTLVHMQPQEVAGLQQLAQANGTSLTRNPMTGYPEAFSLGGVFKAALPIAAGYFTGGAGTGLMSSFGSYAPLAAGAATGAGIAAATGDDPIMGAVSGGLGGMSGGGLEGAFAGVPEAAAATGTATSNMGQQLAADAAYTGSLGGMQAGMANQAAVGTGMNVGQGLTGSGSSMMTPQASMNPFKADALSGTSPAGRMYDKAASNLGTPEIVSSTRELSTGINPQTGEYIRATGNITPAGPMEMAKTFGAPVASMGLGGLEASDFMVKPDFNDPRDKYDPRSKLNLSRDTGISEAMSRDTGLRLLAKGGYLKGPGDGMSDDIPATINGDEPAALADGEFVVPADVVSHLGNGSSEAGSKQLYAMMDRIRKARTGRESQGKEIEPGKYMPR